MQCRFSSGISGSALNAKFIVEPGESIQSAIVQAIPGDTIEVESRTYEESIDINKWLALIGNAIENNDCGICLRDSSQPNSTQNML